MKIPRYLTLFIYIVLYAVAVNDSCLAHALCKNTIYVDPGSEMEFLQSGSRMYFKPIGPPSEMREANIVNCSEKNILCVDFDLQFAVNLADRNQSSQFDYKGFRYTPFCTLSRRDGSCFVSIIKFAGLSEPHLGEYGTFVYQFGFGIKSFSSYDVDMRGVVASYIYKCGSPFLADSWQRGG